MEIVQSMENLNDKVRTMSELMRIDEEYRKWIQDLGNRYKTSQIKASIRVNNEMLMYYWSVGKDITERHADSKWGNKFFFYIIMDMTDMIPNAKGFSPTNLRYMMRSYTLFKDIEFIPQLGEQLVINNESKNVIIDILITHFEGLLFLFELAKIIPPLKIISW